MMFFSLFPPLRHFLWGHWQNHAQSEIIIYRRPKSGQAQIIPGQERTKTMAYFRPIPCLIYSPKTGNISAQSMQDN